MRFDPLSSTSFHPQLNFDHLEINPKSLFNENCQQLMPSAAVAVSAGYREILFYDGIALNVFERGMYGISLPSWAASNPAKDRTD